MSTPEEEIRRLVEVWIRKADLDLNAVTYLATKEQFRDIVVFHAQQAVEKYLKALLTRHQIEFPKTHEIRRLLALLHPAEPALAEALADTAWLEPFGVEIRYPGDIPDALPGDELRALEMAQRVREAVMAAL